MSKAAIDDNARKFTTELIVPEFFSDKVVKVFTLRIDWLETNEASEKKLAHKTYSDGTTKIFLVSKVSDETGRKTIREPITAEQYDQLKTGAKLHLEKVRREFSYEQDGITYDIKYDVFAGDKLHLIEVDAASDEQRASFDPNTFPYALEEVTNDERYAGYRICAII